MTSSHGDCVLPRLSGVMCFLGIPGSSWESRGQSAVVLRSCFGASCGHLADHCVKRMLSWMNSYYVLRRSIGAQKRSYTRDFSHMTQDIITLVAQRRVTLQHLPHQQPVTHNCIGNCLVLSQTIGPPSSVLSTMTGRGFQTGELTGSHLCFLL